jgi:cytochrome c oxidase assembly protein Cox11
LDWATGIYVRFNAVAPAGMLIDARPAVPETIVHPGELFTVEYAVKNRSSHDLRARIVHHVEPKAVGEYLDLVQCALLLPVRIAPGAEQTYASTYFIRSDLPEGTKELTVTYEFKLER